MSFRVGILDHGERARQKQASRDYDRVRLAANEVCAAELRVENAFFSSLNLSGFRIASVGRRPLSRAR
ncbi:hypothetical protein FV223_02150 [Methylobacterium sp. WL116]|nr:hypothetical protein FV223_02150 [Methylobacterium sp. WL116]